MAGIKAAPILEAKDLNTRVVFDLVYNPLETPLIHMARQKGIPIITGIEMFVQQGARQFEIFTGKPAPEEEMFRVVLHALRQQAEAAGAEAPQQAARPAKAPGHADKPAPPVAKAPASKAPPAKTPATKPHAAKAHATKPATSKLVAKSPKAPATKAKSPAAKHKKSK
jgi:3-dehydroquinate dehydratase/shikimate dehydrogenase